MSRRLLLIALLFSLAGTSTAVAGETLVESAKRIAREAARTEAPALSRVEGRSQPKSAQAQPGLATSTISKRKKTMIWLIAGVGFAATAYTIDRRVQDNTPSSLGTREDK